MDSEKKERKVEVCVISTELNGNTVKSTSKSRCHVNKDMLPMKLHFFLFVSAVGVALPFIVVYAKEEVGISTTSIAVLLTSLQFLFIVTKPFICYVADYFNKLKVIIFGLTVVQAVCLFLLLAIPKINSTGDVVPLESAEVCDLHAGCSELLHFIKPSVTEENESPSFITSSDVCSISNNSGNLSGKHVPLRSEKNGTQQEKHNPIASDENERFPFALVEQANFTFHRCERRDRNRTCAFLSPTCVLCCDANAARCDVYSCAASSSPGGSASVRDFQTYEFWSFAAIFALGMTATNGLFTLSDTACCESVQEHGADFGRQRLYGAVGWGTSAVLGGYLNDRTGGYLASWILMAVLTALALCNVGRMNLAKPQFSRNVLKDVGTVLASREYLAFATAVFMCGMGTGVIWFYLVWFLTTIGGSRFLCGLTNAVQCFVGEIPFMFFSGWLVRKLGLFNIMTLALASYTIRFTCYGYLHNPWFVLPVEILHGFTYGLFYPAVATYAKLSAKPGTEATNQAVLFTMHEGLGAGLGCILAGISIDHFGTHRTFFLASAFTGCGTVVSIILHFLIRRQKTRVPTQ